MIPKIIHQLWVGPEKLPLKWMNTWKDKHPDWKYVLWDNEAVKNFKFKNQKHIDYYTGKGIWHGIADVARYEILNKYGGVWQGADSECLHPVDGLFDDDRYDAYTFYQNEELHPGLTAPLMACSEDNEFAQLLIDGLYKKEEVGEPWKTTGNLFVQQTIKKSGYKRIKVFPSHYFVPEYLGKKYTGDGTVYANHHFGTTFNCYDKGR